MKYLIIIVGLLFSNVYGQVFPDDVLPPPYIRSRCNLDEPGDRAFCFDPARRDPPFNWNSVNGHSCKPDGVEGFYRDEQWTFDVLSDDSSSSDSDDDDSTGIGQIAGGSVLIDEYCLGVNVAQELAPVVGIECDNTTALTVWKYDASSGQFKLFGSQDEYNDFDSDSSEESSDDIDFCIRFGVDSVLSNNPAWRRKTTFIEDCQQVGDYGQFDIIKEGDVDNGPTC